MFSFDLDTGYSISRQRLEEAKKKRLAKMGTASKKGKTSVYLRFSGWLVALLESLEGWRLRRSVAAEDMLPCTEPMCV